MMNYLLIFFLAIDIVFTPINICNFIEGKKTGNNFLVYSSIFSQVLLTFSFINGVMSL